MPTIFDEQAALNSLFRADVEVYRNYRDDYDHQELAEIKDFEPVQFLDYWERDWPTPPTIQVTDKSGPDNRLNTFLLSEGITLIAGRGKSGKSTTACRLYSGALAHGKRCCWICGEGEKPTRRKLKASLAHVFKEPAIWRDIQKERRHLFIHGETALKSLDFEYKPSSPYTFFDLLGFANVDLIVIDSLTTLLPIENEINNYQIMSAMRPLEAWCRKNEAAIIIIDHTYKHHEQQWRWDIAMVRGGSAKIQMSNEIYLCRKVNRETNCHVEIRLMESRDRDTTDIPPFFFQEKSDVAFLMNEEESKMLALSTPQNEIMTIIREAGENTDDRWVKQSEIRPEQISRKAWNAQILKLENDNIVESEGKTRNKMIRLINPDQAD